MNSKETNKNPAQEGIFDRASAGRAEDADTGRSAHVRHVRRDGSCAGSDRSQRIRHAFFSRG